MAEATGTVTETKTGTENQNGAGQGTAGAGTQQKTEQKTETKAPEIQSVVDKVSKGEKLTPEETALFKSIPPGDMPKPSAAEKKEEKKEEKPTGTDGQQGKKEETKPNVVSDEARKLIEAELEKPEGQEDLTKFKSPIELALYFDLKKTRKRLQQSQDKLEEERVLRIVERLQGKKPDATASEESDDAEIVALLKDLKPDDVITVEDIQKAIKTRDDRKKAKKEKTAEGQKPLITMDQIRVQKLEAIETLKQKGLTDFHEVTEFAEMALAGDADAVEILRDTATSGGNTALKTYYLIKGSKKWPEIEKVILAEREKAGKGAGAGEGTGKVTDENKQRAEKIEENDGKTKTTGAGGGGNVNPKEYTIAEIQKMTAADVRKLPKAVRQQILEKFGSEVNLSS